MLDAMEGFRTVWLFGGCSLQNALKERIADIPAAVTLPSTDHLAPYTITVDEAFPLRPYLMKPYPHWQLEEPKNVFNYRLAHAWRIVEKAFGILANRFRVFPTTINLHAERVEEDVLACCALHNFVE